jgi:RNA polymerase sigma factor (sigma-70 family)
MDDDRLTRGIEGMSALAPASTTPTVDGEVSDSELVRRVRRDDERAFEVLYHRYHRRITAYIFGMVHDHGRSEDIAQDVFVSALRRMRETDRPIAFKPWVYEIAKNACIDQFRRSRRAEEVSYDADEGLGAADYGRLVSKDAMPEAQLESKTQLDHLRGAFGGLSETHHEILVMRELEGLSYREIGERLSMSRPSVESTLFRARKRLTEEYEELVTGARCQRIQGIIGTATGGEVGLRDQRRLARHVSHCQPCRRQARLAGLDVPVTADRPVRQRIAAMLPLPLFLRRRWIDGATPGDSAQALTGHAGNIAQWSAQLGSSVDPSWLKAGLAAASIAVAGSGAGLAVHSPASAALGGSISRFGDHRAGVQDQRAAAAAPTLSPAAVSRALAGVTSAPTPASGSHTSTTPSRTSEATATDTTAGAPAVGTPDSSQVAAAPSLAQVGSGVPSGSDNSVPTSAPAQPSAPQSPKLSAPTVSVPTVSAPVRTPDVGAPIDQTTSTATGAVDDATKKAQGLVGGG